MLRAWLLALPLAFLIGCGGPEKELPRDVTVATERSKDADVAPAAPAASQPEAVQFVQKSISIATEGHPERLHKARTAKQFVRGKWRWPNNEIADATREAQTVWPDQARFEYEYSSGPAKKFLILFRRPGLDSAFDDGAGLKEFTPPNPKEFTETVKADSLGEYWLPSLVPLMDSKAILFDLKKELLHGQSMDTVKLSYPSCPVYTVWFSSKTSLPGLITYVDFEAGAKIPKQVVVDQYKSFDGISLPTQLESRRGGVTAQDWTVQRWEFPAKIDDALFWPAKK